MDLATGVELLEQYGYIIAFLAGLGEAVPLIGLFIPGQAIIVLAGAAAATGHLNPWLLILAVIPAGILGDAFGYYLGRYYGRALLERYGPRLRITEAHLARSDQIFHKHGPWGLVIGRFSFITRGVVPVLAGMSRMRFRTFWPINVIGAVIWSVAYVVLGYVFGASFLLLEGVLGRILAVTVVVILAIYGAYRFFKKYAEQFTTGDGVVATVAALSGAVFGVLADRVDRLGRANRFDAMFPDVVQTFAPVRHLFAPFDWLSSYALLGVLSLGLLAWLSAKRRVWESVLVGMGIGGIMLLAETIRPIFAHLLPPEGIVYAGAGTFPSASAAAAVVFSGIVGYIVLHHVKRRDVAWGITLGAVLFAVLASISQMAQGYENPSDVLGGVTLGLTWLCVSILTVEFAIKRTPPPAAIAAPPEG